MISDVMPKDVFDVHVESRVGWMVDTTDLYRCFTDSHANMYKMFGNKMHLDIRLSDVEVQKAKASVGKKGANKVNTVLDICEHILAVKSAARLEGAPLTPVFRNFGWTERGSGVAFLQTGKVGRASLGKMLASKPQNAIGVEPHLKTPKPDLDKFLENLMRNIKDGSVNTPSDVEFNERGKGLIIRFSFNPLHVLLMGMLQCDNYACFGPGSGGSSTAVGLLQTRGGYFGLIYNEKDPDMPIGRFFGVMDEQGASVTNIYPNKDSVITPQFKAIIKAALYKMGYTHRVPPIGFTNEGTTEVPYVAGLGPSPRSGNIAGYTNPGSNFIVGKKTTGLNPSRYTTLNVSGLPRNERVRISDMLTPDVDVFVAAYNAYRERRGLPPVDDDVNIEGLDQFRNGHRGPRPRPISMLYVAGVGWILSKAQDLSPIRHRIYVSTGSNEHPNTHLTPMTLRTTGESCFSHCWMVMTGLMTTYNYLEDTNRIEPQKNVSLDKRTMKLALREHLTKDQEYTLKKHQPEGYPTEPVKLYELPEELKPKFENKQEGAVDPLRRGVRMGAAQVAAELVNLAE